MKENINLETRTKVLEYSLNLESHINSLLLGHLEILDKTRTKNFGNKAGISFKSKIDLLYDINVIDIEEHKNLELLMNLRNKFLHDIECNSFTKLLEGIDNGIKNRFKNFVEKKEESEASYEKACSNLYNHNLDVISEKYSKRRTSLEGRIEYQNSVYDIILLLNDLSSDLVQDILLIIEKSTLENPTIWQTFEPVSERCFKFVKDFEACGKRIDDLEKLFDSLPSKHKIFKK